MDNTLTVALCRDCLDAAAEYEFMGVPGGVLPGIAGADVTIVSLEFTEEDPYFTWYTSSCNGDSENCKHLAGDRWDMQVTYTGGE